MQPSLPVSISRTLSLSFSLRPLAFVTALTGFIISNFRIKRTLSMKGMAMRRVLRRLDRIRTPMKSAVALVDSDREDMHAPPSTPLLAKRARQQRSNEGHRAPPSTPLSAKRTRSGSIPGALCESPLTDSSNLLQPSSGSPATSLGCVAFGKRRKSLVTLVVGKERQVFKVEPQMLQHRLLECLLARTNSAAAALLPSDSSSQDALWGEKENVVVRSKKGAGSTARPIRLDCDAILFEHILWLLNNDDPAIRQLNIEELMEFYE